MFLDVLIDLELLWSSCAAFTFKFYHLKLCIFYLFEKKCKNIQDSSRKCVRKIGGEGSIKFSKLMITKKHLIYF
jgi:hypothetical protein